MELLTNLYKQSCQDTNITNINLHCNLENSMECQICFNQMDNYAQTLSCTHTFCYDCLLQSYKGERCNYNYQKNNRICPLCRNPAPYLPLKDGVKPIKNIHIEATKKNYKKKILIEKCKGIIMSGPKKGEKCSCQAKNNGYCGRHKSQSSIITN